MENSRSPNLPIAYFLQKIPAAKWLGANVILWGIATATGAAAHNYPTLLVTRIFLGIFEATIAPSLMLISSQWYTKSEAAPRFSFWYLGLGLGQLIGGIVSFGFQHVSPNAQLSGWRIMFVTLGCLTVLIGLWTFFLLPDTPMKAKWLTGREKVVLLKHVSVNQTGIQNRKFRWKEIGEALIDPQLYLLLISVILVSLILWRVERLALSFARAAVRVQRCRDNLLGYSDQQHHHRPQASRAHEYAVRRGEHVLHSVRWIWHPQAVPPLDLDHCLHHPCVSRKPPSSM